MMIIIIEKDHNGIKQNMESQKSYYITENIKPGGNKPNQASCLISSLT